MLAESIIFFGLLVSPQKNKEGTDLRSSPDANDIKSKSKASKTGLASKIRGMQDAHARMNEDPRDREALQIAGKYGKKTAGKVIDKGIDKAGQGLAAETAGASIIAAELIKRHKKETLILLLIIFCATLLPLFFVLYILIGGNQTLQDMQGNSANPLQVTVTCTPAQIPVGKTSVCTITVTDSQDTNDITVVATIYPFAQYLNNSANFSSGASTKPGGKYDATNKTVTWDTTKLKIPLAAPITQTFMLTVTKTQKIDAVPIVVTANAAGGAVGGVGYVAPNIDNCGGKYSTDIANNYLLHKNFGDPQCNFDKGQLYTQLKQEDPRDAAAFFTIVIPCESGYVPNAWAAPVGQQASIDNQGAWGLFQMGSSTPPGSPPPAQGKNGKYDRGDVNWQVQTSNATTTGKSEQNINNAYGGYWSSSDWSRCG